MNTRYAASLPVLFLAVALTGLLSPSAAQQRVVPVAPDGHPDLQGNWNNGTITPFQRERGRGPTFTRAEVDRLEGRAVEAVRAGAQASDPDRGLLAAGGNIVSYNDVYFERGALVAVVNGEPRSSLLTRPADGRSPALTEEGRRRQRELGQLRSGLGEFDHPELRSLTERCIMFGSNANVPIVPNGAYNNNYTVVQTADYVVIHAEVVHDTRIIPLGEPDPPPPHVTRWMGYSWGRWEGNTLVVETTNIYPGHTFRGVAPTEDLKVTERFTRVDERTILYEFTIDDTSTYVEAFGGEYPFRKVDHLLYEYACHEGNYALTNILRGARYQESQPSARDRP